MGPRRVLVTGGAGQLGRALLRAAPPGVELHATQRRSPADAPHVHTVELSDARAVDALVRAVRPDVVIHTAYGKEDGERDILAATRALAAAVRREHAHLVHISTDVVFDGERAPYPEDAMLSPVDDYGRWKAAAEEIVRSAVPDAAVVRTSLIVGVDPLDHGSAGLVTALADGASPALFVDELRCPIDRRDLAAQLWELAALPVDERAGPWHLVGPECLSRYALGLLVARHAGVEPTFRPAWQREHPHPRPRDLCLTTARAAGALRTRARPVSAVLAGPDGSTPPSSSPPDGNSRGRPPSSTRHPPPE